jgi:creatinine amidohydrolase/Fe(II)-dependent formamide hydrolase-like protein
MAMVRWTSSTTPTGVTGAPALATKEKGQAIIARAARNLLAFIREFKALPKGERVDHRVRPSTARASTD